MMRKWIFGILVVTPLLSHALVDYSEDSVSFSSAAPQRKAARPVLRNKKAEVKRTVPSIRSRRSQSFHPSGAIRFSLSHDVLSTEIGDAQDSGKLALTQLSTHIQTPYNLYLVASYWMASFDNYNVITSTQNQGGNVDLKLGFNWLQFGSDYDRGTIDFYFGTKFKGGDSELAISRNEKIVGIETAKRFLSFAVGFGYEYTSYGSAKAIDEMSLDSGHKLSAALSWQATGDIRFLTEGNFYKITGEGETFQFSSITPKVDLRLSPVVGLQLGGVFQIKKANWGESIYSAKLWDVPGAYGNSIFAKLKFFL